MNFDNVNTEVTIRKFGSSYGKNITDKNLIPVTKREKSDDGSQALQESIDRYKNATDIASQQSIDRIRNQRFFMSTINEQSQKLKDDLFCNILHHICMEAMVIDEEPLYENMENICNIIDENYRNIGGFKAIKENAINTRNMLISKMISLCEETAKKVTDRNLKAKKDENGELSFDLTEEEKDEFNFKKGEIGIESVIDNVKSKVIDVVKEEKKANEEKSEMIEEIKNELTDADISETTPTDNTNKNNNNEKPKQENTEEKNVEDEVEASGESSEDAKLSNDEITEALSFIFDDKIETTTLFESLMRKNYKTILENSKSTIFESCDSGVCSSEEKKPNTKDKTYKIKELDAFDDEDFDDEADDDLMINENTNKLIIENLTPDEIDELEEYISEGIRIQTRPGNLGIYGDFDTGVGDIIRAAKKDAHCVDSITLPGFKNKLLNLIKSCKNGADVRYVNQLAGLPARLFRKKQNFTGYYEDYTSWLKDEYEPAYQEVIEEMDIDMSIVTENLQHSGLSYKPVNDLFISNARNVLSYMNDEDMYNLEETYKRMGEDLEEIVEGCKGSKKKINSCKESIRRLQKDTEELQEESNTCKKAKEACNMRKACEGKTEEEIQDELSEMLVCPDCGEDPCVCDNDEILHEYSYTYDVDRKVKNDISNKVVNKRVDMYGHVDYNKLAAAGIIAGGAAAVAGGVKAHNHNIKKICQRDTGVNGNLERWQKKIMKQIRKTKKPKDLVELKISLKNDMKKLEKGKKKNPDYKIMIDNQLKWYKNVAMKEIAKKEKEFNISEDYEYSLDISEEYLFEDFLAEKCNKINEDDEFDDDDYDDEYDDDDFEDEDDECEECYVFDVEACVEEMDNRKDMLEEYILETNCPQGLDIVQDAISDDITQLVKTRNILKDDPTYNEYIQKINNYIDWLQTTGTNLLVDRRKEISGDPMVESYDDFNYFEEAKKIGKLQAKMIKKIDNHNLGSMAKRDWKKVQKKCEKKVKKAKTMDDIKYLESDSRQGDFVLNRVREFIKNDKTGKYADRLKPLEDHIKWCKTEYPALIKARKKEIKNALNEQAEYEEFIDEMNNVYVSEGKISDKINEYDKKQTKKINNSYKKSYETEINKIKSLEKLEKTKAKYEKKLEKTKANKEYAKKHPVKAIAKDALKAGLIGGVAGAVAGPAAANGFVAGNTYNNTVDYEPLYKYVLDVLIPKREKELKKALKESVDFDDELDIFNDDIEELTEGIGGKKAMKVQHKIFSKESSRHAKKSYLKRISKIDSLEEVKKYRAGLKQTKAEYNLALKQEIGNPDYMKQYIKWLDEVAKPALDAKEKELKQKKITESFVDKLDELCESLDEVLDSHDEAKYAALESLYVNFNNNRIFAPILHDNDINKDNLSLAYRLKSVCESLKGLTQDADNPIEMAQSERLVDYNMNQISKLLEDIEYEESLQCKCDMLNEAYNYLNKLKNKIPVVMESLIIESDYVEPETITEAIDVVDDIINASKINLVTEQTNDYQMEVVMAEAIVNYTIMEAFNTMRITDYKHEDVKRMVRENLNQK